MLAVTQFAWSIVQEWHTKRFYCLMEFKICSFCWLTDQVSSLAVPFAGVFIFTVCESA